MKLLIDGRAIAAVHHRQLPPIATTPHRPEPCTPIRWRNGNTSHPDVLAAQRRERARIRRERGVRWGGRSLAAAS